MPSFRFIHAADLHLDTPFEGIGRVAPELGAVLRDASLDAWDALVDFALEEDAAFVVLAGDLYDGPDRGVRAPLRFVRGAERLAEKGVRVFAATGNHDALADFASVARCPDNVKFFGTDEVEPCAVERGGEPLATVHGIGYPRPDVTENLALRFQRGDGPGLHVGVLHCNVGGRAEHEPYSPCSLEDLERAGMDYWALGHVHQAGVLREGAPWVVYSGNTQGRSPKPTERGEKGAYAVDVVDGEVKGVRFRPLDRVRFVAEDVDVSELDDLAALERALLDRQKAAQTEHAGRGIILRAHLVGRGGLHDDLRRPGTLDDLLTNLREPAAEERPPVWWERLSDATRPAISREAILKRDDFSAELLKAADRLREEPEQLAAFLQERLADLQRPAAVRRWLKDEEPAAPEDLLNRAEDVALDLMETKDE